MPPGSRVTTSIPAPTAAAAGSVKSQATTIFPAIPQRTAEKWELAPEPSTELETTWVVDTGKPKCAVNHRTLAAAVSAAKPCGGSSFAIRWPRVRTILQPPAYVPAAIARAAAMITQSGTWKLWVGWAATSASAITPIVFCASFVP